MDEINLLGHLRSCGTGAVENGHLVLSLEPELYFELLDIADAAARLVENRDGRLPLVLDVDALVVAVESLTGGSDAS